MMKKHEKETVLIVDDDARIRDLLRIILESRGYCVGEAENGEAALSSFSVLHPDMVILDVMMPVMDGFECLKKLREISDCPVLMLTARDEDYDQVTGLDCGADDYVIKPFTPMVLAARVQALFRRNGQKENRMIFGSLRIDAEAREVFVDAERIALNRKEFDLLRYLVQNHNISLSRDQILESVWGYDYLGSPNTVDTHINRLRSKLGCCCGFIVTLRGYGYRFEA